MNIFIIRGQEPIGPYSDAEITDMLRHGEVLLSESAWREGDPQWTTIGNIMGIASPPLPAILAEPEADSEYPAPLSTASQPDLEPLDRTFAAIQTSRNNSIFHNVLSAPHTRLIVTGSAIALILIVVFLGVGWLKTKSEKEDQRKELTEVLKKMTLVCVATEQGLNQTDFRSLVRNALAEYKSIQSFKRELAFPLTVEEIEKAFKCWEGAVYFWSIQGKFDSNNEPQSEDYRKLVGYLRDAFGDEAFKKLQEAEGGVAQFLYNEESIDFLIPNLFSIASSSVEAASIRIKME